MYQNFDPAVSSLSGFEDFSLRKTKIFTNVILDNFFPEFEFLSSDPVKPKPKPPKFHKMLNMSEIEKAKRIKRAKQLMFTPFSIYDPPAGKPWGTVPEIAIMAWETDKHLNDTDKELFLFERVKLASPKIGYHYIPIFYAPTNSANKVDGKLVFIPYVILVKTSQKPLDIPTLGVFVWNIEKQREHFVRFRRGAINEKAPINRDLATKVFTKPKPKPKIPPKPLDRFQFYEDHEKFLKNQTAQIAAIEKLQHEMAEEINLADRRSHEKLESAAGVRMQENGGYAGTVTKKHLSETEKKITELENLLDEKYESIGVDRREELISSTFPLIELDPGSYPVDAVLVNQHLPNNSRVLNLKLPVPPVPRSKFIPLFFGKSGLKTRDGLDVWIPNFILVPQYFTLPMDPELKMPKKIPSYIKKEAFWDKYDITVFPMGRTSLTFSSILSDKQVLTPPFKEEGHYITQETFNSLVERKTKKAKTVEDILKVNKDRIKNLIEQLNSPDKPIVITRASEPSGEAPKSGSGVNNLLI